MTKKILWLVVSGLMALSLVMAACAPAATPTTPTTPITPTTPTTPTAPTIPEKEVVKDTSPKYGGTIKLATSADITVWDDIVTMRFGPGIVNAITNETMWQGDWAKGPAGGYGTKETDWVPYGLDVFEHKTGMLAESWKWTLDAANDRGTLVYQIRRGVRFALNPKSEASRLVGGREMTADDVIFSLQQVMTDERSYMWKSYPELRDAKITKTGPWEVTINVSSVAAMITAVAKFGEYVRVVPQEVVKKYGGMGNWQNSVGTGPFMITDYIAGSTSVQDKNPNYWMTDPIGPGKGNRLPYIDSFIYIILPDVSTQQAALRTGKIDAMTGISYEDAASMRKTAPELRETEGQLGGPAQYVYMNSQRKPFNDIKVRRAILMSIDLELIKTSLNHGLGQVLTWPVEYISAYKDIYLGLDDPEMPASVKELYTYNPDKAKQLLKEAGYPSGFKTTALIASTEVDYFSIIKDMLSKVGIDLALDVREIGTRTSVYNSGNYEITGAAGGRGSLSVFYHMVTMVGGGPSGGNGSNIDDPIFKAANVEMKRLYITDPKAAMGVFKNLMKYALDQAYVVSRPIYPLTTFWWPWVKNYSGEQEVGYVRRANWPTYIWIDQALKKEMGH